MLYIEFLQGISKLNTISRKADKLTINLLHDKVKSWSVKKWDYVVDRCLDTCDKFPRIKEIQVLGSEYDKSNIMRSYKSDKQLSTSEIAWKIEANKRIDNLSREDFYVLQQRAVLKIQNVGGDLFKQNGKWLFDNLKKWLVGTVMREIIYPDAPGMMSMEESDRLHEKRIKGGYFR